MLRIELSCLPQGFFMGAASKQFGRMAVVGRAHDLKDVGQHFGLEHGHVGNAGGKDRVGPKQGSTRPSRWRDPRCHFAGHQEARITAEEGTAFPEASGGVAWVETAFDAY
jgi:hypothetical protein